MTDLPSPPPSPPPPGKGFPIGRFVLGLAVLAIGVAALLEALDVSIEVWKVVLPGALIAVGAGLVISGLRSVRSQGGLIAIGIVLTVVLTIASIVGIPFEGGVGDRVERPSSQSQVKSEYRLAIGLLTIDLTQLPPRETGAPVSKIQARVGLGQLVVVVPFGTLVDVDGHAGVGDVTIFGRSNEGFDVDNAFTSSGPVYSSVDYSFDLSVGVGEVTVRYG
jgi:hypothetical protein